MAPDKMEMLINSDKEWRKHILGKLDKIEERIAHQELNLGVLKVKVAVFGSLFGAIWGIISGYIVTHLR